MSRLSKFFIHTIPFILFSFLTITALGQSDFTVMETDKSEVFSLPTKRIGYSKILVGKEGYYIFEKSKQKVDFTIRELIEKKENTLLFFNKNLELVRSKKMRFGLKKLDEKIEYTIFQKDKIAVFTSAYDNKAHKKYIYLHTINPQTLDFEQERKKLLETHYEGFFRDGNFFRFTISPDSSHYMIHEINVLKKNKELLMVYVFNNKNELVWKKEITPEEVDIKHLRTLGAVVDNNGKGYISIEYGLVSMDKDSMEYFTILDSHRKKTSIRNIRLTLDNDQNLSLIAFYADHKRVETRRRNISGLAYVSLKNRKANQEPETKFIPFSNELLGLNAKKKPKPNKMPKMKNMRIKHVFYKKNNNMVVIAERNYSDSHGTYNTYYHKNILVFEMNENGEILWFNKIAKHGGGQKGYTWINFLVHRIQDEFYFIYNDSPKNLDYKGYGKIYKPSGSFFGVLAKPTIAKIDKEGNLQTITLYKNVPERTTIIIIPWLCNQVSDNEFILSEQGRIVDKLIREDEVKITLRKFKIE